MSDEEIRIQPNRKVKVPKVYVSKVVRKKIVTKTDRQEPKTAKMSGDEDDFDNLAQETTKKLLKQMRDEIQKDLCERDERINDRLAETERNLKLIEKKLDSSERKTNEVQASIQQILGILQKSTNVENGASASVSNSEQRERRESSPVRSWTGGSASRCRNDQVTVELFAKSGIEFSQENKYHPHKFIQNFENATADAEFDEKCKIMLFRNAIKIKTTAWASNSLNKPTYEQLKEFFLDVFWDESSQSEALHHFKTYQGNARASVKEIIYELQMWHDTLCKIEDLPKKKILRYIYEKIPYKHRIKISIENMDSEKVLFERLRSLGEFHDGSGSGVMAFDAGTYRWAGNGTETNETGNYRGAGNYRNYDDRNYRGYNRGYRSRGQYNGHPRGQYSGYQGSSGATPANAPNIQEPKN